MEAWSAGCQEGQHPAFHSGHLAMRSPNSFSRGGGIERRLCGYPPGGPRRHHATRCPALPAIFLPTISAHVVVVVVAVTCVREPVCCLVRSRGRTWRPNPADLEKVGTPDDRGRNRSLVILSCFLARWTGETCCRLLRGCGLVVGKIIFLPSPWHGTKTGDSERRASKHGDKQAVEDVCIGK